jgi:hypothetical protein
MFVVLMLLELALQLTLQISEYKRLPLKFLFIVEMSRFDISF